MSDLTQRSRPGGETEAAGNRWAATDSKIRQRDVVGTQLDDVVRCSRCHHPLTAERSIQIELGPVCRKAVAA